MPEANLPLPRSDSWQGGGLGDDDPSLIEPVEAHAQSSEL